MVEREKTKREDQSTDDMTSLIRLENASATAVPGSTLSLDKTSIFLYATRIVSGILHRSLVVTVCFSRRNVSSAGESKIFFMPNIGFDQYQAPDMNFEQQLLGRLRIQLADRALQHAEEIATGDPTQRHVLGDEESVRFSALIFGTRPIWYRRLSAPDYTSVIQELTEIFQRAVVSNGGFYQGATGDGGFAFFLQRSFGNDYSRAQEVLERSIDAALEIAREYATCLEMWRDRYHGENFDGNELGIGIAYGKVHRASFVPKNNHEDLPPEYAVVGKHPRTINAIAVDLANAAKHRTIVDWAAKESRNKAWAALRQYGDLAVGRSAPTVILMDLEMIPGWEKWELPERFEERAALFKRSQRDDLLGLGGKRGARGCYGLLIPKEVK